MIIAQDPRDLSIAMFHNVDANGLYILDTKVPPFQIVRCPDSATAELLCKASTQGHPNEHWGYLYWRYLKTAGDIRTYYASRGFAVRVSVSAIELRIHAISGNASARCLTFYLKEALKFIEDLPVEMRHGEVSLCAGSTAKLDLIERRRAELEFEYFEVLQRSAERLIALQHHTTVA